MIFIIGRLSHRQLECRLHLSIVPQHGSQPRATLFLVPKLHDRYTQR